MINREFAQIIGNNIKRLRTEKGLLQKELGEQIGYEKINSGRYMINRLEHGNANIPLDKLINLANILDVPFTELFRGVDELAENESKVVELSDFLDNREMKLIEVCRELNEAAIEKIVDYARDLHSSSLYRKPEETDETDEES